MANELMFSGNETIFIHSVHKELFNNFTYEFWAKPTAAHEIDNESTSGEAGISGKKYAISPCFGGNKNAAGMGVSVGTNGVSVYEHSIDYLPALLVYKSRITDWTHIAIVYRDKTPFLYINGQFIKKGLTSAMDFIFPSSSFGGCAPYGFFEGSLKNMRIWKRPLTENEIKKAMNQNLSKEESGLFCCWNQCENAITHLDEKKDIEITVIIPSHNKYPQNLLTLYSLEKQTFDLSKVEVIFIDDASTDMTASSVMGRPSPYLLKYIKCEKNAGRSRARNLGIRAASGNIIIFLDAEILVENDFIEQHFLSHKDQPNLVVSAVMQMKGVYSIIFPDFGQKQLHHVYELLQSNPEYFSKWQLFQQTHNNTVLFTKEDIITNKFQALSFSKPLEPFYENLLLKIYGDDFSGFHFPWLAFLSGNVSLRKDMLQKSGYFEESFEGYGWEDAELGYRLHLAGASFFHQRNIHSYHQEHPVSVGNIEQAQKNYQLFRMKHPVIDVYLLALLELGKGLVFQDINHILSDYRQLCHDYPNSFTVFKNAFKAMLEKLGAPPNARNHYRHIRNKVRVNKEKLLLEQSGKYGHLVKAFHLLANL
ncbi:MAG: glycosyltransferase [Ectobacillus sp.]